VSELTAVVPVARCVSCDAEIIWTVTATSGRRMPIDVDPQADGNVALVRSQIAGEPPTAIVLGGAHLERARRYGPVLYRSHFASCPHAARWRRPQRKETK